MYCVMCGVELAESERVCPLCKTRVYFPGISENPERPYPLSKGLDERNSRKGMCFLLTSLFIIASIVTLVCDLSINMTVTFADFVIAGIAVAYVMLVLPRWFAHPSPTVFIPFDFFAAALLLFYVNFRVSGNWFFSFALPVTVGAGIICTAVCMLCYYLRRGYLYIFGGAFIITGIYIVFIELCEQAAFIHRDRLVWSPYPAVTLSLIGILLITAAFIRPLREQLEKIFFL